MGKVTLAEQRAHDIIDYFRGWPGEKQILGDFLMLDTALAVGEGKRKGEIGRRAMYKRCHVLFARRPLVFRVLELRMEEKT